MERLALSLIERCDPEAYRYAQHSRWLSGLILTTSLNAHSLGSSENIVDVFFYGARGSESQRTEFPCISHTDPGFLTLIFPHSPGLEVKTRDGEWLSLNLGPQDLAMVVGTAWTRLTDTGGFPGCYHRVRHLPSSNSPEIDPTHRSSFTFEVPTSLFFFHSCSGATEQGRGDGPGGGHEAICAAEHRAKAQAHATVAILWRSLPFQQTNNFLFRLPLSDSRLHSLADKTLSLVCLCVCTYA